jgi:hypothetical protein
MNVVRSSKLTGADAPTFTAEQLVAFLASYENHRKANKYGRRLRGLTDIKHPVFDSLWDINRPDHDVCYDDIYDQLIGKFVPQSGISEDNLYPGEYYDSKGVLIKSKAKRYCYLQTLKNLYYYFSDPSVGMYPAMDIYQFALDNPEPDTYMDKYDFSKHNLPAAAHFNPDVDLELLDIELKQTSGFTRVPTTPPSINKQPVSPPAFRGYKPQSGIEDTGHTTTVLSSTDKESITTFVDENPDWSGGLTHSKDDSYYAADTGDVSLNEFFARPILVSRGVWFPNNPAPFRVELDPLALYWNNPRVSNKVCNYRNMRCNMKLKITVNGSQFHFGRAIACHSPKGLVDTVIDDTNLMQLSQLPHIFIDPATSQGGTLTLPYLHDRNSYNIVQSDFVGITKVIITAITKLGHLGGTNEAVNINTYLWAEDVVLSCPTNAEPLLMTPQSGDEYGKGIVSRTSYAIAHRAGMLKDIPGIKPYATATQIGAGAVGDVARMFGFARPTNVSESVYAKPVLTEPFANVDRTDTIPKLTFDSKQETTVDPRTVGLGEMDHMAFLNIVQRETYLTNFKWKVNGTNAGNLLWNSGVAPWLHARSTAGAISVPACAFITAPFTKWRGSMRFRFQVCSSPMHRGRLRISYDPNHNLTGKSEHNTVLSEIVDIGANSDFSIVVGWHQPRSYLDVPELGSLALGAQYGSLPLPLTSSDLFNGFLTVQVENELTTPGILTAGAGDVTVNVYISACEDYEVHDPSPTFMESYLFLPQAGFEPQSGVEDLVSDSSHPEYAPVIREFGNKCKPDHSLIYHGDPIVSVRSAVKRYTLYRRHTSGTVNTTPQPGSWTFTTSAIPKQKGKGPAGDVAGVAYVHLTPITYFSIGFLGFRGGIRHKMMITCPRAQHMTGSISRWRTSTADTNAVTLFTAPPANTGLAYKDLLGLAGTSSGWSGLSTNSLMVTPMIEAEIPYSTTRRYIMTRAPMPAQLAPEMGMKCEIRFSAWPTTAAMYVDDFVSAADDFSLFYFVGCPLLYKRTLT